MTVRRISNLENWEALKDISLQVALKKKAKHKECNI